MLAGTSGTGPLEGVVPALSSGASAGAGAGFSSGTSPGAVGATAGKARTGVGRLLPSLAAGLWARAGRAQAASRARLTERSMSAFIRGGADSIRRAVTACPEAVCAAPYNAGTFRRPSGLMLQEAALFLAAAVLFVPLFKRARLGSVLGYLAAGLVIGPHGLGYARDAEQVLHASEFGVVLLLFVIGLGLQPRRLWTLRREVFGLGGAQVLLTALPLALFAHYFGVAWAGAAVIGLALAMSSTALVLQLLGERGELTAHHGRGAFAVLLFQDITVIPLLALIPLLSAPASAGIGWQEIAKALAVVAAVIASGRTLLRPALRLLANAQVPEIFTAASLLLVIGVSLAMQAVGLSASLGASWPACCWPTPNTATSCRPTSNRSRACCWACSSSPSAWAPTSACWPARRSRCWG